MSDPALDEAIKRFSDSLEAVAPEFKDVFDRLKRGELGSSEAMSELMRLAGDGRVASAITEAATQAFKTPDAMVVRGSDTAPAVQDADKPPIRYQGTGLPRINPLVEAAIAERVQFDGDAPELRRGPLPEGVAPAVPVATDARSLVSIGMQLAQASAEVAAEIKTGRAQHAENVNRVLDETAIAPVQATSLPVFKGPPGYQTGQIPALRGVQPPTGTELAALSAAEQQGAVWQALSTTQGRRSALQGVEELLLRGLERAGYPMEARPCRSGPSHVYAVGEWTCQMSGAASTQADFAFVPTAVRSILRQLLSELARIEASDLVLEVFSVDAVANRQVGWGARVVAR